MEIGKYNELRVARKTDNGLYLRDEEGQEVLLPRKFVPREIESGTMLTVFVYKDGEDRLVATTQQPLITLGQFAYLKVVQVNRIGAFLDWGLDKDLFVPFREQKEKMETGRRYLVYLYLDEQTDRLVASARTDRFLEKEQLTVAEGEEVDLLVSDRTELGYNVIINDRHSGLIYHSELFRPLHRGDRLKGYIQHIREDKKIDVSLDPVGYQKVEPNAEKVLARLRENEGFLPLTDKSPPADIYAELEMSKKTFKKALGALYKQRIIRLEPEGIYLV